MALVLLEQGGKLSLEDDVHKYLPELPDYGQRISIRNLLQHTSGISDYGRILAMAGWRNDEFMTQQDILRVLFRKKDLDFVPGSTNLYSNSGYALAAEIVSRVAGKPFAAFCKESIFAPLGMKVSHFPEDVKVVVANRANPYRFDTASGTWTAPLPDYASAGAAGLLTTATELASWLENFNTRKVGDPSKLQEQAVLSDGRKVEYGLGIALGKYRGLRRIGHAGSYSGYESCAQFYPDQNLDVVVLSNIGSFAPCTVAEQAAVVFLGDRMEPLPSAPARSPTRRFVDVDSASLVRLEGDYKLEDGAIVRVRRVRDKLTVGAIGVSPRELKALAPDRFWDESRATELQFTEGGKIAIVQANGTRRGQRQAKPLDGIERALDYSELDGAYWSFELETQYKVKARDGRLQLAHARHGELVYEPTERDAFTADRAVWTPMPNIFFTRDKAGRVDGFVAARTPERGLRFVRR